MEKKILGDESKLNETNVNVKNINVQKVYCMKSKWQKDCIKINLSKKVNDILNIMEIVDNRLS